MRVSTPSTCTTSPRTRACPSSRTSRSTPADVASETFEREKDFSILEQVEAELADVERALRRIDDGSYGKCEACGSEIGDDRLEAMPAARFCIIHQTQAEADAS